MGITFFLKPEFHQSESNNFEKYPALSSFSTHLFAQPPARPPVAGKRSPAAAPGQKRRHG